MSAGNVLREDGGAVGNGRAVSAVTIVGKNWLCRLHAGLGLNRQMVEADLRTY
jgi:hypothetical protein